MFSLREFLKNGFKDAVGKMADYQIILNASGYYEKGVLLEEDLAELQELINTKNIAVAESTEATGEVQATENNAENTAEVAENAENVDNLEKSEVQE